MYVESVLIDRGEVVFTWVCRGRGVRLLFGFLPASNRTHGQEVRIVDREPYEDVKT